MEDGEPPAYWQAEAPAPMRTGALPVPNPPSRLDLLLQQWDENIARRKRRPYWIAALGIAAMVALIAFWNMQAAEATRRAEEAARAAELARQSQELVRFLPERVGKYRRVGAAVANPGTAPAATANYILAANPGVSVTVRVTHWNYPNMGDIFRASSDSAGLVNARSTNETYRGQPAILFTAGNNPRNYFASYAVLVADRIVVYASSGGSPEQSKRHARAAVQAMPLTAISAWRRAN